MTAKDLKKAPDFAPGKGVAEALHAGLMWAKSEAVDATADTQPALLFNVPANTLIYDVILNVTTALEDATGNPTIAVGIDPDSDLFFSSTDIAALGTHSAKDHAMVGAGGYVTSSDEVVEASWLAGCSAGAFEAWIIYSPHADENHVNNP